MNKIVIKIEPDSNAGKIIKKYTAEKAAFKSAVSSGNASSFVKKSGTKFDSPISIGK